MAKVKILDKIQTEYRKSKVFFFLKVFTNVVATYFAFRVIFVSVAALTTDRPSPDNMNILLFSMLLSVGLSNVVQLVEMLINKKTEHFKLLFITTLFILGVSIFVLPI